MRLLTAALTVAGVAVLFVGTARAAPLVFFGTAEERAGLDSGRRLVLVALVILVVAAALVLARDGLVRAAAVAAPGVVSVVLLYAFPSAAWAWAGPIVFGPVAIAVAVIPLLRRD